MGLLPRPYLNVLGPSRLEPSYLPRSRHSSRVYIAHERDEMAVSQTAPFKALPQSHVSRAFRALRGNGSVRQFAAGLRQAAGR